MIVKNQKGISLITLSIAIVILVIITSILVYNAKEGVHVKRVQALYNDIELLNDKVASYYLEYGTVPVSKLYANKEDSNNGFIYNIKTATINGKNVQNPNDGNSYYVLDLKSLEAVSLNYGNEYDQVNSASDVTKLKDIYVINKVSHTIYYVKGITQNGITYYAEEKDYSNVDLKLIPIYTAEQLSKIGSGEKIAIEEMDGIEYTFSLDGTYLLKNDIDLSSVCHKVDGTADNDVSWTPIGTEANPFTGTFYGENHEINNLYINSSANYQGLFGYTNGANIQDLGIASGSITTTGTTVGALISYQKGGTVQNCYNNTNITASRGNGGICGYSDGNIYYCYNTGNITSTITNNTAASSAGIVSTFNSGNVKYCYNAGTITSGSNCVGGIVGANNSGIVESCYNKGNIKRTIGVTTGSGCGGVVGYLYGTNPIIRNCYNTANITGISSVGGICGSINVGTLENCYNISINITASNSSVGGIFGGAGSSAIVNNCYSLQSSVPLYGNLTSGGTVTDCSQKTETEMKTSSFIDLLNAGLTGTDAPWVYATASVNGGYPALAWQ